MYRYLLTAALILVAARASAQNVGDLVVLVEDFQAADAQKNPVGLVRGMCVEVMEIKGDQLRIDIEHAWLPKSKVLELAAAEKHFAAALEKDAKDDQALEALASIHSWQEHWDKSLAEYSDLIKRSPSDVSGYLSRGDVYWRKGEAAKSLDDYLHAKELDPMNAAAFDGCGSARCALKRYAEAAVDFDTAIRLDDKGAMAIAFRVWFLATCPEEKYRDGKHAVKDAKQACELCAYDDSYPLDALAAAEAEVGNFADAIRWEKKALELAPTPLKEGPEKRLKLYQAGKPYREKPGDWK